LCDENLDDPLEALYCYRMYLQLTPENHPDRQKIRNIVAGLQKRAVAKYDDGKKEQTDAAELENLQSRVRARDRKIVQQQQVINRLNSELKAEKQKNSRRNKK